MGGQMEGLVFGVLLAMSSICLAVALVVVSWFVVGGGCVPERGSGTLTVELSTCICSLMLVSCRWPVVVDRLSGRVICGLVLVILLFGLLHRWLRGGLGPLLRSTFGELGYPLGSVFLAFFGLWGLPW